MSHLTEALYSSDDAAFEDNELDNTQEKDPFLQTSKSQSTRPHQSRTSICRTFILTFSILLNTFALYKLSGQSSITDWDGTCAAYVERYESPLLDEVGVRYQTVQYNGSFTYETIYRQEPSLEVDAAWDALGVNLGVFMVPEEDGGRFGFGSGMVKRVPEQGGGYAALSEGMHHLHCLNLLRQSLYFNYDYYRKLGQGAFLNEESVVKNHVGHCMDILRQQLMCSFDTGVFGQWFVQDIGPFVDFNTEHRCKNFHALHNWIKDHQVPKSDGGVVQFRKGDRMLSEIP